MDKKKLICKFCGKFVTSENVEIDHYDELVECRMVVESVYTEIWFACIGCGKENLTTVVEGTVTR